MALIFPVLGFLASPTLPPDRRVSARDRAAPRLATGLVAAVPGRWLPAPTTSCRWGSCSRQLPPPRRTRDSPMPCSAPPSPPVPWGARGSGRRFQRRRLTPIRPAGEPLGVGPHRAVIPFGSLSREQTGRAWVLLAGYLVGLLASLVDSRAPTFGRVIGLEYRYLTDALCVVACALDSPSSPSGEPPSPARRERTLSSGARARLRARRHARPRFGSGVFSTTDYAPIGTRQASEAYLRKLTDDLRAPGAVDLVDQFVPKAVMYQLAAPNNTVSRMACLVSDDVHSRTRVPPRGRRA